CAQLVTVNGEVAWKLKTLLRVKVLLPFLIAVNVPTAYIVPPHCTSWRICSTWLVFAGSCGKLVGGVGETTPAGGAPPTVPACAASRPTESAAAAELSTIRYFHTGMFFSARKTPINWG